MKDISNKNQENCRSAFLVPFFGNLPPYFNLWAKSCEINYPYFQWFVYNDKINYTQRINKAVTIIPYQFDEMISDFQKILNINILGHNTRRVCDYRIMYYFLRQHIEALDQFDFIGYTDMDMIYGQLNKFLPSNMTDYSMISADTGCPCGPFTLIKRSSMQSLLESDIVKNKLEIHEHESFNESKELMNIVSNGKPVFCQSDPIQPTRAIGFNYRKTFSIWDKGRVRVWDNRGHEKEGGFYHFSRFKDKNCFKIREDAIKNDRWGIYKYGIVPIGSKWTILLFRLSLLF